MMVIPKAPIERLIKDSRPIDIYAPSEQDLHAYPDPHCWFIFIIIAIIIMPNIVPNHIGRVVPGDLRSVLHDGLYPEQLEGVCQLMDRVHGLNPTCAIHPRGTIIAFWLDVIDWAKHENDETREKIKGFHSLPIDAAHESKVFNSTFSSFC
jgi:hypothetical protein